MASQYNSTRIGIKWAFIYLILLAAFAAATQFLSLDIVIVKFVSFITFIAFTILAQSEYKRKSGGFITFGEAFLAGFKFSAIAMLLTGIFIYLYWTIIDPQAFAFLVEAVNQQATSDTQKSAEQQFLTPGFFSIVIALMGLIIGIVISLIGAAILKKDRPAFITNTPYTDPAV